ncbi:hypothetical protein COV20_02060 [Candidatus Woesearchaeota archaeon CG10_big_fil_rev_8_21_14_0_10_45_16]|nr:MAG: hypothetical protein COV20_02060 [Candidatus Woesearchaeota archaeon CG10_big_fil_rev_8_21_14_0_10_45_16]
MKSTKRGAVRDHHNRHYNILFIFTVLIAVTVLFYAGPEGTITGYAVQDTSFTGTNGIPGSGGDPVSVSENGITLRSEHSIYDPGSELQVELTIAPLPHNTGVGVASANSDVVYTYSWQYLVDGEWQTSSTSTAVASFGNGNHYSTLTHSVERDSAITDYGLLVEVNGIETHLPLKQSSISAHTPLNLDKDSYKESDDVTLWGELGYQFGADANDYGDGSDKLVLRLGDVEQRLKLNGNGAFSHTFEDVPAGDWQLSLEYTNGVDVYNDGISFTVEKDEEPVEDVKDIPEEKVIPVDNVFPDIDTIRNKTGEKIIEKNETTSTENTNENIYLGSIKTELKEEPKKMFGLRGSKKSEQITFRKRGISGLGVSSVRDTVELGVYDVNIIPDDLRITNVEVRDVIINGSVEAIFDYNEKVDLEYKSWDTAWKIWALNPTSGFSEADITFTATGNKLYKCQDWDWEEQQCYGEWNLIMEGLIPGEEYTFTIDAVDPGFGEELNYGVSEEQPSDWDGFPTVDVLDNTNTGDDQPGSFGAAPAGTGNVVGATCTQAILSLTGQVSAVIDSGNYDPNASATITLTPSTTGTALCTATDTYFIYRCFNGNIGAICNQIASASCSFALTGSSCTPAVFNTHMDTGGNITSYFVRIESDDTGNSGDTGNAPQNELLLKDNTFATENTTYNPSDPDKNPAQSVIFTYAEAGYEGSDDDNNGDGWDGNVPGDLRFEVNLFDPDGTLTVSNTTDCNEFGFCNASLDLSDYAEAGTYNITYNVTSADRFDSVFRSSTVNVRLIINKTETKAYEHSDRNLATTLLNAVEFNRGEFIETWAYIMNPDDNDVLQTSFSSITDNVTSDNETSFSYDTTNNIVKFRTVFDADNNANATGVDYDAHVNISMNGQHARTGDTFSSKNALVHLYDFINVSSHIIGDTNFGSTEKDFNTGNFPDTMFVNVTLRNIREETTNLFTNVNDRINFSNPFDNSFIGFFDIPMVPFEDTFGQFNATLDLSENYRWNTSNLTWFVSSSDENNSLIFGDSITVYDGKLHFLSVNLTVEDATNLANQTLRSQWNNITLIPYDTFNDMKDNGLVDASAGEILGAVTWNMSIFEDGDHSTPEFKNGSLTHDGRIKYNNTYSRTAVRDHRDVFVNVSSAGLDIDGRSWNNYTQRDDSGLNDDSGLFLIDDLIVNTIVFDEAYYNPYDTTRIVVTTNYDYFRSEYSSEVPANEPYFTLNITLYEPDNETGSVHGTDYVNQSFFQSNITNSLGETTTTFTLTNITEPGNWSHEAETYSESQNGSFRVNLIIDDIYTSANLHSDASQVELNTSEFNRGEFIYIYAHLQNNPEDDTVSSNCLINISRHSGSYIAERDYVRCSPRFNETQSANFTGVNWTIHVNANVNEENSFTGDSDSVENTSILLYNFINVSHVVLGDDSFSDDDRDYNTGNEPDTIFVNATLRNIREETTNLFTKISEQLTLERPFDNSFIGYINVTLTAFTGTFGHYNGTFDLLTNHQWNTSNVTFVIVGGDENNSIFTGSNLTEYDGKLHFLAANLTVDDAANLANQTLRTQYNNITLLPFDTFDDYKDNNLLDSSAGLITAAVTWNMSIFEDGDHTTAEFENMSIAPNGKVKYNNTYPHTAVLDHRDVFVNSSSSSLDLDGHTWNDILIRDDPGLNDDTGLFLIDDLIVNTIVFDQGYYNPYIPTQVVATTDFDYSRTEYSSETPANEPYFTLNVTLFEPDNETASIHGTDYVNQTFFQFTITDSLGQIITRFNLTNITEPGNWSHEARTYSEIQNGSFAVNLILNQIFRQANNHSDTDEREFNASQYNRGEFIYVYSHLQNNPEDDMVTANCILNRTNQRQDVSGTYNDSNNRIRCSYQWQLNDYANRTGVNWTARVNATVNMENSFTSDADSVEDTTLLLYNVIKLFDYIVDDNGTLKSDILSFNTGNEPDIMFTLARLQNIRGEFTNLFDNVSTNVTLRNPNNFAFNTSFFYNVTPPNEWGNYTGNRSLVDQRWNTENATIELVSSDSNNNTFIQQDFSRNKSGKLHFLAVNLTFDDPANFGNHTLRTQTNNITLEAYDTFEDLKDNNALDASSGFVTASVDWIMRIYLDSDHSTAEFTNQSTTTIGRTIYNNTFNRSASIGWRDVLVNSTAAELDLDGYTWNKITIRDEPGEDDKAGIFFVDDLKVVNVTVNQSIYDPPANALFVIDLNFSQLFTNLDPADEPYDFINLTIYETDSELASVHDYVNDSNPVFFITNNTGFIRGIFNLSTIAEAGANWTLRAQTYNNSLTTAFDVNVVFNATTWYAYLNSNSSKAQVQSSLHNRGEQVNVSFTIANNPEQDAVSAAQLNDDLGGEVLDPQGTISGDNLKFNFTWKIGDEANSTGINHTPVANITLNNLNASQAATVAAVLYDLYNITVTFGANEYIVTDFFGTTTTIKNIRQEGLSARNFTLNFTDSAGAVRYNRTPRTDSSGTYTNDGELLVVRPLGAWVTLATVISELNFNNSGSDDDTVNVILPGQDPLFGYAQGPYIRGEDYSYISVKAITTSGELVYNNSVCPDATTCIADGDMKIYVYYPNSSFLIHGHNLTFQNPSDWIYNFNMTNLTTIPIGTYRFYVNATTNQGDLWAADGVFQIWECRPGQDGTDCASGGGSSSGLTPGQDVILNQTKNLTEQLHYRLDTSGTWFQASDILLVDVLFLSDAGAGAISGATCNLSLIASNRSLILNNTGMEEVLIAGTSHYIYNVTNVSTLSSSGPQSGKFTGHVRCTDNQLVPTIRFAQVDFEVHDLKRDIIDEIQATKAALEKLLDRQYDFSQEEIFLITDAINSIAKISTRLDSGELSPEGAELELAKIRDEIDPYALKAEIMDELEVTLELFDSLPLDELTLEERLLVEDSKKQVQRILGLLRSGEVSAADAQEQLRVVKEALGSLTGQVTGPAPTSFLRPAHYIAISVVAIVVTSIAVWRRRRYD